MSHILNYFGYGLSDVAQQAQQQPAIRPPTEGTHRVYHGSSSHPNTYGDTGAWVASTPEYARNYGAGSKNVFYMDVPTSELPPSIQEQYELNGIAPSNFKLTPEQTRQLKPYPMTPPQMVTRPPSTLMGEEEKLQKQREGDEPQNTE